VRGGSCVGRGGDQARIGMQTGQGLKGRRVRTVAIAVKALLLLLVLGTRLDSMSSVLQKKCWCNTEKGKEEGLGASPKHAALLGGAFLCRVGVCAGMVRDGHGPRGTWCRGRT
jgi:hypothetical protein